MSANNHDRKIRQKIRNDQNFNIRIVTDYGRLDTLETNRDIFTQSKGFKCHKGGIEAHFFFERPNRPCGFVEKKFHITKKYINAKMCYFWTYSLRAHDFREYIIDNEGVTYNAATSEIVVLPYFTQEEWVIVAQELIKFLAENKETMDDQGHAPLARKKIEACGPQMRKTGKYIPNARATHSLVQQMRTNYDGSSKSVFEDVTHAESYWTTMSRKQEPHTAHENPMFPQKRNIRLSDKPDYTLRKKVKEA